MTKYILGLDVGVTSVGWGIIDAEKYTIVDAGVHLFSEATASENVDRRTNRSARRLIRRRHHRMERLRDLLIEYKIISDGFSPLINHYDIRVKGLHHKLSNEELATAILSIAKHRGISGVQMIEEDEESLKDSQSTKEILGRNANLLNNKFVCEVQLERYQKSGKIRGIENCFYTDDYVKELKQIFSNQTLDLELQNKIIDIIRSKREYYDGPGSRKSPTPYGRFNLVNGEIIEISMIDKMRGHCTIYPNELRAPKMSYSADLFNFLNDLNNLTVCGESISKEQKEELIDKFIRKKGSLTVKQLLKYLGVEQEQVDGFRKDKNDNPILTEFKGYKIILKKVIENNLNPEILEPKVVDLIADILTTYKSYEERTEQLKKINGISLTDLEINILANLSGFKNYHSLSYKVIYEVLPSLLETNYNQMQLFQLNHYFELNKIDYSNRNSIAMRKDLILSPVARRAEQEAIKVVNKARQVYGEFDSVVVEMARDKNSEEKQKRIRDNQKKGEVINKAIEELIGDRQVSGDMRTKIRLYLEQTGKCPYTGKTISLDELLRDPYLFEIDHIIPISISFDDSLNNKVLVYRKANQEKSQRTPYQYFKSKIPDGWTYEDFKNYVISNPNYFKKNKKKALLLFELDINRYEVKKQFISRNLVDTRYATRELRNMLDDFYKAKGIPTKVHTVNGAVTSIFRKKAQIPKSREEDYSHHAVDALIVAGIKKMKFFNQVLDVSLKKEGDQYLVYDSNEENKKLITLENEEDYYDSEYIRFVKKLRDISVKYSHKIDTKPNRVLTDATIYSTREKNGETYVLKKLKNIYDKDGETLKEKIKSGKEEDFLMFHHDPASFQILKDVVEQYSQEKNPFEAFYKEHQQYIYKHSKKNAKTKIISLKYYDEKLGTHLDITHHYKKTKGEKQVILKSVKIYRIDMYQEPDGRYKFLKVNYHDLKQLNNTSYVVPLEKYEKEKERRKISKDAKFLFSLHTNELFYFKEKSGKEGLVRYSTIDYNSNTISYKLRDCDSKENLRITIGKKTIQLQKYSTDILGNVYKCEQRPCKFEIPML